MLGYGKLATLSSDKKYGKISIYLSVLPAGGTQ